MSKTLAAELEVLANQLKSDNAANGQLSMPALSERIAKSLHVNPNEAAILAISGKWRDVHFMAP
jgi:hypothetical protein